MGDRERLMRSYDQRGFDLEEGSFGLGDLADDSEEESTGRKRTSFEEPRRSSARISRSGNTTPSGSGRRGTPIQLEKGSVRPNKKSMDR